MNEDALVARLEALLDPSQPLSGRDERFLAAALILTRLPSSTLQRLATTDQTVLRFCRGLVSDYIARFDYHGPNGGDGRSGSVSEPEKEREAYLALSATLFAKYYDHENVSTHSQSNELDIDIYSCVLKAMQLRSQSEIPPGSLDIDILKALGEILSCHALEKQGLVRKLDGTTEVKAGSQLEDWMHAPTFLIRRCFVDVADHGKKRSEPPSDQRKRARCLLVNTIDSVLTTRTPACEASRSEVEHVDYRFQYMAALTSYLEAHLSQSLNAAPSDLICGEHTSEWLGPTVATDTDTLGRSSSSEGRQLSVPYERDFLLDLFRYVVEFPSVDERKESVIETRTRLNSLALIYISSSTRGNWQSIGQFDLGNALRSCKSGDAACVDDEITASVLKMFLHCLLFVPAGVDASDQAGNLPGDDSYYSTLFETIAMVIEACDLHWMIRDVNMITPAKEAASELGKGTALCSVIRLVVGNLRMSLGRALDHIADDIFASVDSLSGSLKVVVACLRTLNGALKFVLLLAEDMVDSEQWSTSLNSEALLHIRSSIEDSINSVIQFLADPVADSYRGIISEKSSGQVQGVSGGNTAYECAAVACCSFLGIYFAEESVFSMAGRSKSADVASAKDILCALYNCLSVCFSIVVRESRQVATVSQKKTCDMPSSENSKAEPGAVGSMRGESLISLLPCLTMAISSSIEEGEKGLHLLATAMLKDSTCTSAVCFLMEDLFLGVNKSKQTFDSDSQVLAAYICCCEVVKTLLATDQLARDKPNQYKAAELTENEKEEMQPCLLAWSRYLVRHCRVISEHSSDDFRGAEGKLALILTADNLSRLLGSSFGSITPEAAFAIKEANELIGGFP